MPDSYSLGIDLGTTFTAAAIARNGHAEMVTLGAKSAAVPSVVYLKSDGTILVGEAAVRRAATDPGRVGREFKRRIGDTTPILLGGSPYAAESLMAKLLRWTVDAVIEREGGAPAKVVVCHPANWGPYKLDLLMQAVRIAEVKVDHYLAEPEAAAISWAAAERVPIGTTLAVYDLGGGTFDAAVLRKRASDFELLGDPEGIERLGGVDFDQALFTHVSDLIGGGVIAGLDPTDPTVLAALAHLRQEVVDAKEALSSDSDTTIAVFLPGVSTKVRVTRQELEAMARPPLADTVAALRRALRSAGVSPEELGAVVLIGGSSRMPLVADMITDALHRPVAVDAHPKHAVALGAALAAAGSMAGPVDTAPPRPAPPLQLAPPIPVPPPPQDPVSGAATADPNPVPARRPRRRRILVGAAAAVLLAGGVIAALALRNRDGVQAAGCTIDQGVCITSIAISDGRILAEFEPRGVDLASPSGDGFAAGTVHPLFFFRQSVSTARIWGASSPFGGHSASGLKGFAATDEPHSGADLCVLLQTDDGTIIANSGNCVPVPVG